MRHQLVADILNYISQEIGHSFKFALCVCVSVCTSVCDHMCV